MPIYEYQCAACGHKLEALQKVGDMPLTRCPQCSEHALRKVLTAAGFRLKGSGWYETDFKDSKAKKSPEAKEAVKPDKAAAKKSTEGKSDQAAAKKSAASQ